MGCYRGLNVSFPQSRQTMASGQVANPRSEQLPLIYDLCLKPAESSLASESESSSLNGLWMGGGIARDILAVVFTRSTKPGPEALWAWLGQAASWVCSLGGHCQQLLLVDTPHSLTGCFCAGDRLHCQTRFTDWTCECILAGCFGQQVNPGLLLAESDVRRVPSGPEKPPPAPLPPWQDPLHTKLPSQTTFATGGGPPYDEIVFLRVNSNP